MTVIQLYLISCTYELKIKNVIVEEKNDGLSVSLPCKGKGMTLQTTSIPMKHNNQTSTYYLHADMDIWSSMVGASCKGSAKENS